MLLARGHELGEASPRSAAAARGRSPPSAAGSAGPRSPRRSPLGRPGGGPSQPGSTCRSKSTRPEELEIPLDDSFAEEAAGLGAEAGAEGRPASTGSAARAERGPGDLEASAPDAPDSLPEYVDWVLARIGGWGEFQRRYCFLLASPWALCGAQTLAHIFVTAPPVRRRVCSAGEAEYCSEGHLAVGDCGLPRSAYEFEAQHTSVAAEFGLVCESSAAVPLLGTLFFVGFLCGAICFGGISDRRGRRVGLLGALLVLQSGALLAACAPTYPVYAVARALTGAGAGGVGLATYAWNAEILGAETRAILVVTTNTAFAVGVLLLSPLSYVLPEWRWLSFALFLAGLPLLAMLPCLRESPAWLAGPAQRPDDAHAVLCQIAAANGQPPPPAPPLPRMRSIPQLVAGMETRAAGGVKSRPGLWALLGDPRLATRYRVMCLAWLALSLGYYGLSMNVANLGGSVYVSSALAAAVELPTYPVAFSLAQSRWLGRRGTTMCGLVVGGACCILSAFAVGEVGGGWPRALTLTLVYVGKASISMSFGIIYLYAVELFPTDVRTQSMGLQSLCARIGGMLAPVVADLGRASQSMPLVVFGAPCVAAGLLLAWLPETLGRQLPCSIEDIPEPTRRPWKPCLWSFRELQEEAGEVCGSSPRAAVIGSRRA